MKKIIAIMLCLFVVLFAVACGGGQTEETETDAPVDTIEAGDTDAESDEKSDEQESDSDSSNATSGEGDQSDITEETVEDTTEADDGTQVPERAV